MLPRNAMPILLAREQRGLRPTLPLVVSFVGDVGWENPQVFADPGVEYDWRFLFDLPVYVAIKPGIDCRDALAAIYREAKPYPTVVDTERKRAASLIGPRSLWHWAAAGAHSKELFS